MKSQRIVSRYQRIQDCISTADQPVNLASHTRWALVVLVFCALALFISCGGGVAADPAPPASIVATHNPVHPGSTQTVTFKGEDTSGDIDKIELAYERYSLSGPEDAKVQTLVEPKAIVETCDPAGTVAELVCEHTMTDAFADGSLIAFTATSYNGDGESSVESYSFAAGDYPWPEDPIPVRVKGSAPAKFDIVFIPDTDISVADFLANLDEVLETIYFKYDLIKDGRWAYNFYYSGIQGDYSELCNFTDPSNMANLTAIADTVAILHQAELRDCKSGKRMSSEIDYDKTLIHESGHALFGLQDEYCCDSSYAEHPVVPNIWSSLSGCEDDAADIGHPESHCTQISKGTQSINFWYIDPTGPTGSIMGSSQRQTGSDFGKASRRRINWRYVQCSSGNCYSIVPEAPESLEAVLASENGANDFDVAQLSQTPQLAVEIEFTDEGAKSVASSIIYMPVQTENTLEKDVMVTFEAGEDVVDEYLIADPRLVEIEGLEHDVMDEGSTIVYTPFSSDLTNLEVTQLPGPDEDAEVGEGDSIDLTPLVDQACEEQPDLEGCS